MRGRANPADGVTQLVRESMAAHHRPVVIGICGAQGSGKSTVTAAVARQLTKQGRNIAVLSLDDLYLPRADRRDLALAVHPLLATRGVPGTHDVLLGAGVIDDLVNGKPTFLPRFDKAIDDRTPRECWPYIDGAVDAILFEGWCVGAIAQEPAALIAPVNRLEAEEDRDGRWRRYVNDALGHSYSALFARLDRLVLLAAPDFTVVSGWRREQEHALRRDLQQRGLDTDLTMRDDEIAGFVAFYERLTRHILAEMPARADLVLQLDAGRNLV